MSDIIDKLSELTGMSFIPGDNKIHVNFVSEINGNKTEINTEAYLGTFDGEIFDIEKDETGEINKATSIDRSFIRLESGHEIDVIFEDNKFYMDYNHLKILMMDSNQKNYTMVSEKASNVISVDFSSR